MSLLSTHHPSGPAELVLSLDTGPYQGRIVKRIPFVIDNPWYGKPIVDHPATAQLKAEHPRATVVELYHEAPLPQFGLPSYDGVRDVYFGDDRQEATGGGSCTSHGTDLSYGTDLRFQLQLGGEARRTLIKYDLSMLPPKANVVKALLLLHVEELDEKADRAYRVVALKKRWSEAAVGIMGGLNATNVAKPFSRGPLYPVGDTENWDEPRCIGTADRYPEPVALVSFEKTGWTAIDVTAAVKNWVIGQWPNHGLVIEMVKETYLMGRRDIVITASDSPVDPRRRPRLSMAIEGDVAPAPYQVREVGGGLNAALAKSATAGKPVLCHVLSAGSITSRQLEGQVLCGLPAIKRYIDEKFVEVRLDGDRPEHQAFLKSHGVRRFPTALVLGPEGRAAGLLEPFDWDAPLGLVRSSFEFEQLYSKALEQALRRGP